jgi:hypothetical protein
LLILVPGEPPVLPQQFIGKNRDFIPPGTAFRAAGRITQVTPGRQLRCSNGSITGAKTSSQPGLLQIIKVEVGVLPRQRRGLSLQGRESGYLYQNTRPRTGPPAITSLVVNRAKWGSRRRRLPSRPRARACS